VEVEDEVELAHVAEVSIQNFYEVVDNVKHDQLVVALVNAACEV
jgi:hypothetical protein